MVRTSNARVDWRGARLGIATVSDACYAPKYSLTDKAVLCKFSVNARAPCGVQWESLQRALSCRGLYVWN